MSMVAALPSCLLLVLRRRTAASSTEVLTLAIDDLVARDLWRIEPRRRRLRRVTALVRTDTPEPGGLPAPLPFVHRLLEKAIADPGISDDIRSVAQWFGYNASRAGNVASREALEQLIRDGLLTRSPKLALTPAGTRVLEHANADGGTASPALARSFSHRWTRETTPLVARGVTVWTDQWTYGWSSAASPMDGADSHHGGGHHADHGGHDGGF
jgi:hypothetical protein